MVKLVVLKDENVRLFGKMPDGTLIYTVKQHSLNGPDAFPENGEIDVFLKAHGIKFRLKDTLVNRILSPKLVVKPTEVIMEKMENLKRFEVVETKAITWEQIYIWLHLMAAKYAKAGGQYALESVEIYPDRCIAHVVEITNWKPPTGNVLAEPKKKRSKP
jgi:hypothetical protein